MKELNNILDAQPGPEHWMAYMSYLSKHDSHSYPWEEASQTNPFYGHPGTGRYSSSILLASKFGVASAVPITRYIEKNSLVSMLKESISSIELIPYFESKQILNDVR